MPQTCNFFSNTIIQYSLTIFFNSTSTQVIFRTLYIYLKTVWWFIFGMMRRLGYWRASYGSTGKPCTATSTPQSTTCSRYRVYHILGHAAFNRRHRNGHFWRKRKKTRLVLTIYYVEHIVKLGSSVSDPFQFGLPDPCSKQLAKIM